MDLVFGDQQLVDIEFIIDGEETQSRAETNEEAVARYIQAIENDKVLAAVRLVRVAPDVYETADGHHTIAAHRAIGRETVLAVVAGGNPGDALAYGMTAANGEHGLPLSKADRRKRFDWLTTNKPYSDWTDKKLAPLVGVDRRTLGRWRDGAPSSSGGAHCAPLTPVGSPPIRRWQKSGPDTRPAWLIPISDAVEKAIDSVLKSQAIMERLAEDPVQGAYVRDKIARIRKGTADLLEHAAQIRPVATCPSCGGNATSDAACGDFCMLGFVTEAAADRLAG